MMLLTNVLLKSKDQHKKAPIFRVERYNSNHRQDWNDFVNQSKNATFLFHRDFMEYHQDRFEDYSLLVFKNDQLAAILPANRVGDELHSHQGLTYGGLLLLDTTKLLDAFKAFKSILKHLEDEGIKKVIIKVIPTFFNRLPADELEYVLFKANAVLLKRDVIMLIDQTHKLRFQKNRREGINKAKRSDLVIKMDGNFDDFWNDILIPNLDKKHKAAPIHTLEEIKLLALKFPENIKQINIYKNNKIVAGTTLFITKTTLHPQYVSANSDKNADGSLDLLYDYMVNDFPIKRQYFDFNTSSENNGKLLNEGLIFWKESCGARTFATNVYEVSTNAHHHLEIQLI